MFMNRKKILSWSLAMAISLLLLCGGGIGYAKVTGVCSNCHTMHNSQGGAELDVLGPYQTLLKGGCIGCHSHGTESQSYSLGTSTVPVVNYTGGAEPTSWLAGGNFYWVADGNDSKGHNVYGLADQDVAITAGEGAPGNSDEAGCTIDDCHATLAVKTVTGSLPRPGGCQGCHLNVMHHADDGTGTKYVGTADAGWYRFLSGHSGGTGVAGIEHSGWGPSDGTVGGTDHNEYLGVPESKTGATSLSNKSMTAFCSGCHGNFHEQQDASGNWIRHPSDVVIPNTVGTEYAAMSTFYDPLTPLARSAEAMTTLGNNPSGDVAAGADMVMCLSCHRPHGSPYDDMLRWDYGNMVAGSDGTMANRGCFYCHTTKDAG
jgi:predicted CXXCH cytochrome family protein